MSTSDSCKDGASKSNSNDGICEVNDMLNNMSTDNTDVVSVCANCGKEGSDINNVCNKCRQVKYCNAACKKKHRSKHKKDCEEHLRRVTERHDETLFKQPPSLEGDCPICFLKIPSLDTGSRYQTCCGKVICSGCFHAPLYDNQGNEVDNEKGPFCRAPTPTSNELNEMRKKRLEADDPIAIYNIGCCYVEGLNGFPQDIVKALEYWHRAVELGDAKAYTNIGSAYNYGRGVEQDEKKATYYYELAAMKGDADARHNLGNNELRSGNIDRALRHYMIAVKSGDADSLNSIQKLYTKGFATKEDYTKALRLYQEYLGEIKSDQRDKAAAEFENCHYY